MGYDTIKSSIFGTKSRLTRKQEILHVIAKNDPARLKKYLNQHPEYATDAIRAFQDAHFERFYKQPHKKRDNFLQCGIELMEFIQSHCPTQAWAQFNKRDYKNEATTAHWIATLGGYDIQNVAKKLSDAMLDLATDNHPWHLEDNLPPKEQYFYKWMHDQAEPGFNSHLPNLAPQNLHRWMTKLGPIAPKGWEAEYLFLALSRNFMQSSKDALLMLNRPGVNLYAKMDEHLEHTELAGTANNNILHMVALLQRHDQRFLFDALNELRFRDSPNSAGLYGAQAILQMRGELNTKHGVRPAFGMQLPLQIEGNPNEHPFERLAIECEIQGLNKDAHHLRLSLHAKTDNQTFRDCRNVADYAMYKGMVDVLKSAMNLGDHVIAHYALNSKKIADFESYTTSNSVLYTALEMWNQNPEKYVPVVEVMLNAGLNDTTYQEGVAKTLDVFSKNKPDAQFGMLPIQPTHPTLDALARRNPELHQSMMDARQMTLDTDAPQMS